MKNKKVAMLLTSCALAASLTMTACGTSTTTSTSDTVVTEASSDETEYTSSEETTAGGSITVKNQTLSGTVTAIDGNTVTVEVSSSTSGNGGGMSGDMGSAPGDIGEMSGDDSDGGTPPEMPSEDGNAEEGAAAETEDGSGAADSGESTPPEKPDGDSSDGDVSENSEVPDDVPEAPNGESGDMGEAPGDMGGETAAAGTIEIVVDLGSVTITDEDGAEISVSDLAEGDTISLTYDENGSVSAASLGGDDMSMGMGGDMGGGNMGGGGSSAPTSYTAVTEFSEDTEEDGQTYDSTGTDENAILVDNGASVSISNATITKNSDDSTGGDDSSFYGVGASVLNTDGTLIISDSTITSDSAGGAGVFSYGDGVTYVSDTTITTQQDTSGGIHVAGGGTLYAWNLNVSTSGTSSAAIRSDRGGGTMVVDGGTYVSNGSDSPAVYVTADIAINDATLTSNGAEGVCIEGLNTLNLYDSDITSSMTEDERNELVWNIIVYQSQSGDSEEGNGTFNMTGGSITASEGGIFYTTNTESTFYLNDVDITYPEDCDFFLRATGNSNERGWGTEGANGADTNFTADNQDMVGDIITDSISNLDFYMENGSTLTGAFIRDESNAGNGGSGETNVYISSDSTWTVTGDSVIDNLYCEGTIVDEDGNTVTIVDEDGNVLVEGSSAYTITVGSYETTADFSGATTGGSFSDYAVEQP